ncbi:MAG TPA: hypothetical protein VMR79_06220, partial [Verrucomicrobiae bacterium]|nr:hypothetical protein [Verrucomicrobiae bacterium]
ERGGHPRVIALQPHVQQLRDLDRLNRRGLVLCDPVLTEACFHLPHGVQRARLARLLVSLGVRAYEGADQVRLRVAIFEWLAKYADHQPDWADGCLAVVSQGERRWKMWTYDREFRRTWRRPDGTPIPLAAAGTYA